VGLVGPGVDNIQRQDQQSTSSFNFIYAFSSSHTYLKPSLSLLFSPYW